jgi:DNA-binding NtrC family response regulator
METRSGRILIVDDEPSLLKMMSVYLKRLGFNVFTADTTEKAWAEIQASPDDFAIAVVDATMDGLSMEELADRFLTVNPAARVIAASGYPVDTSQMEAAAPGRVAFLHKPFSPEMLAATVRRMLGSQEQGA